MLILSQIRFKWNSWRCIIKNYWTLFRYGLPLSSAQSRWSVPARMGLWRPTQDHSRSELFSRNMVLGFGWCWSKLKNWYWFGCSRYNNNLDCNCCLYQWSIWCWSYWGTSLPWSIKVRAWMTVHPDVPVGSCELEVLQALIKAIFCWIWSPKNDDSEWNYFSSSFIFYSN